MNCVEDKCVVLFGSLPLFNKSFYIDIAGLVKVSKQNNTVNNVLEGPVKRKACLWLHGWGTVRGKEGADPPDRPSASINGDLCSGTYRL